MNKENISISIEDAKVLIRKGEYEKAIDVLASVRHFMSDDPNESQGVTKEYYADFFRLLAEAKWLSQGESNLDEIIHDLNRSLDYSRSSQNLRFKADIYSSVGNSEYKSLYQKVIKLENSAENHLKYIIAHEKNNQHSEALKHFRKLLKSHFKSEDISEIKRFLRETKRDRAFRESGRYSAYKRDFYNKYPTRKRRTRSRKKKSAKKDSSGVLKEILWPLLTGFLSGFYVSVFYIMNNLTMLPGASMVAMFLILTIPAVVLVIVLFGILKIFKKDDLIPTISIVVSSAYMLLILRPAITEIGFVSSLLGFFGGANGFAANVFYVVVPATLLVFIFKGDTKKFLVVLGAMIVASFTMNFVNYDRSFKEDPYNKWSNWPRYEHMKLSKKPNIFFIISDGYSSFAYMRDNKIDISGFQQFLEDQKFRIYDEVFSNYQFTLQSMPAFLNMEHHHYTTIQADNATEVNKSGRVIVAGNNNFFRVLKTNGYSRQNIHEGTYLLLRGHDADYSYPQIDGYTGAKIVLARIFNHALLAGNEDANTKYGTTKVHDEIISHLSTDKSRPVVQYVHIFKPSHSPNEVAGKCEEQKEVKIYAEKIKDTNPTLKWIIKDIIKHDPEAVIVLAGDHGPYISNKCDRFGMLKTPGQIRDRVGILTAIRWPDGYDGRYDKNIKTSVNILRYLLASLAENEADILKTVASDDVYVMMKTENQFFFKIVENGKILTQPKNLYVPEHLQAAR